MQIAIAVLLFAASQDVPMPTPIDERLVIELVARDPDVTTPVGVDVDAKGRVWVIESNTHFPPKNYKGRATDRILIFEDFGPDGRAKKITTFAEGFRYGMGLGFSKDGDLFFATRWEIHRWSGPEDARKHDVVVKLETKGNYPHNGLSGFAFDASGAVYFGMGENLGADYTLLGSDGTAIKGGGEGGNIFRCRPDGTKLARLATGFWNPFHLCFDARGRLFTVDNDPDSRPPCRLLHVVDGGDYGFKFRNGRKGLHPFTAWFGELPGTLPMVAGTGEAPSGMLSYERDALPAEYRGTILATSWGDHLIQRFALVSQGASFVAKAESIVKGGENFRPVGIAQAPDGSVFISDWVDRSYELHGKGRLWRLRAKTPGTAPTATRAPENTPALLRMNEILAVSDPGKLAGLLPALTDADPFLVSAAIETLSRVGGAAFLLPHAADPNPKIRLGILLALRRTPDTSAVAKFLDDNDVAVRRAAIQWVGEAKLGEHAGALEKAASRLPVTKPIFEAYLAATDLLSGKSAAQADQLGSETLVAKMFDHAEEPAALRVLAMRLLRRDHPSLAIPKLEKLLSGDPLLRLEAIRVLATRPEEPAQALLRKAVEDPALRFDAVSGLALSASSSEESRRVLLAQLEGPASAEAQRALSAALEKPEVREALEKKGGELAALLLARPAGQPTTIEGWRTLAADTGDAAAGERLFFHPKGPQCFVCHKVNGRGGVVGPELSTIGFSLDRARLAESILEPGREIAPMFVHWKVRTKKGDILDGRLLEEDSSPNGMIVLINAQGVQTKVKNVDIDERQASALSIMPDKLVAGLTPKEFRDLIEFLAGLK